MSTSKSTDTELVGWKQISAHLGMAVNTAKRLYREEGLPAFKLGGRYYADRAEIDKWRERQSTTATLEESTTSEREPNGSNSLPEQVRASGSGGKTEASLPDPGRKRIPLAIQRVVLASGTALLLVLLGLFALQKRVGAAKSPEGTARRNLVDSAPLDRNRVRPRYPWLRDTLSPQTWVRARLEAEGQEVIVAALWTGEPQIDKTRLLTVLDPTTGQKLDTILLTGGDYLFPDFSDRYRPILHAEDLDGDTVDELLITYDHFPNFPSYTVLYEPRIGISRVVFASTGHHIYAGSTDLNDDNAKDLLFLGVNNLVGWHQAIAAVELKPAMGSKGDPLLASSPNKDFGSSPWTALLWYALAPPDNCTESPSCLEIDEQTRLLTFHFTEPLTLDFQGFDANLQSQRSGQQRSRSRKEAWNLLRGATSQWEAGYPKEALASVEKALEYARDSEAGHLVEWTQLQHVVALIIAGQPAEADRLLHELQQKHRSIAGQLAFDPAVAYHVAGDFGRAVSLYRSGFVSGSTGSSRGRPRWEFLRGLVLASTANGDVEIVAREIEQLGPSTRATGWTTALRAYIRWFGGGSPRVDLLAPEPYDSDLIRYWHLEFLWRRGKPATTLFPLLQEEQDRTSEPLPPLLQSLKAVLLDSVGRRTEARETILEAHRRTVEGARRSPILRSHLWLVERRREQLVVNSQP